jgi:hypothetical protein
MELAGFIVGPERSGTTVTAAFLSQHPEVYVINDPHYLNFFAETILQVYGAEIAASQGFLEKLESPNGSASLNGLLDKTLHGVRSWYERWNEFKDDPVDLEAFYTAHITLCSTNPAPISKYFHKFHLSLVPHEMRIEKSKYVVKIPDLARYGWLIRMIYPTVPVIFNVRHPVCNIASIIEPNRDRGWSFEQIISWYRCFFPEDIVNQSREGILFTRYEDLIFYDRPNSTQKILSTLGLDCSDVSLKDDFTYPNNKVMYKTKGRLDAQRLVSSLQQLTPLQLMQSLEQTVDIQNSFYKDISLMKMIQDVQSCK